MKLTDNQTFPGLWDYLTSHMTQERKERFEKVASMRTYHISVVIEDVFQPQNASAVIRTCECFGIQKLHIIENNNEYNVNPDVVRGSDNWIHIHRWNKKNQNTVDCLKQLKQEGYTIAATSLNENSISLYDLPVNKPLVLVFGNEGKGISSNVKQHADVFVKIPMYGFTESFNISVSAAICLSHLTGKMRNSDVQWQLPEKEQRTLLIEWMYKHLKNPDGFIERFINEKANNK
jgi:tRNA (guanosine-2'-O-)-methyltransferase